MSFIKRLEKRIGKKEKDIEKERKKIETLKEKLDSGKFTKAEYNIKRRHIGEQIKHMDARVRVLRGGITKEKHNAEEKIKEKEKKQKEKQEKKAKKKK